MARWHDWAARGLLLLPALILAGFGIVEFESGSFIDAAFPVPEYLSIAWPMPKTAYAGAAELLRNAGDRDGSAQISRAEAMLYAGYPLGQIRPVLEKGLEKAPASAEGWFYEAVILASLEPKRADPALDQAFSLAPDDYFLAVRRAQLAAQLWADLSPATRDEALRQTRDLWTTQALRPGLLALLRTGAGASLVMHAFDQDPDTIRAINRWIRAEQRQPKAQGS